MICVDYNEIVLRDYQVKAIEDIKKAYLRKFIAPILVLPTCAGKTIIFCKIAQNVKIR